MSRLMTIQYERPIDLLAAIFRQHNKFVMFFSFRALDGTEKPSSADFIKNYNLDHQTGRTNFKKNLIEKGTLDESYHFIDPLFETWFLVKNNKIM